MLRIFVILLVLFVATFSAALSMLIYKLMQPAANGAASDAGKPGAISLQLHIHVPIIFDNRDHGHCWAWREIMADGVERRCL